ncbi:MAG: helix-turn-helix domain-containing protein [Anaerolineaceae bacterium]
MITNERQYKITKSQCVKLAQALSNLNGNENARQLGSEILAKAERDALISEMEVLESQIKEYESLRSGIRTPLTAGSLRELPQLLVRARIMQRLSQKELANLVGVKEQQIQRYESEGYRTASLTRVQTIAEKLNISVTTIRATVGEAEIVRRVRERPGKATDPVHPKTGSHSHAVKVVTNLKREKKQAKAR